MTKSKLIKAKKVIITFDTADTDSAGVANTTIASHGTGFTLPKGAILLNAYVDVITTFTSATDAATIALTTQTAGDLKAAIAISDTSNVWDSGIRGTLVTAPNLGADAAHDTALEVIALYAALPIKMTAQREVTVTVAVEALTAGKMNLILEYVV